MSNRSRRRELLSGIGLSGFAALPGCLESVASPETESEIGGTDRTLRLGVLLPTSGDLESLGVPMRDSAVLPVEQVEDDVSFEFDVQVEDTETSPSAGIDAATRLVDAEYPMVTGPASSGATLQATQQVLIPHRIASCSPSATTPTITALNDIGLVYRTAVSDTLQARVLADRAATDLDHERAATLYVNNDYGWQLSQAFTQAFETDHDGAVTTQVPFEEARNSYADELERAREDDPTLLVVVGYPESGAQLFDDFAATGGEEDVLVTDGLHDGGLHDAVDHSLEGIRGTVPLSDGPGTEEYLEILEDHGHEPELRTFAGHSYDATAVLLLANAYAGQNDGQAIANAIDVVTTRPGRPVSPANLAEGLELAGEGEQVVYEGVSGPIEFDENGDTVAATFEYWEYDDEADGGIREIERVSV
ncbi:ABC transporter substrate-binding protein [Natronobacterium texcoconense]|uniref:ABC-type branched-chain amino acid transport system, substrate-binding protein n=1 Tax=Natronobacterium texcoconense TaxID=1095778 RepID=A0A1H1IAD3_NATTX|nr:ABC transporter substrate-binding protein [Natronobacterium texcoconense]SDR34308.1 ABC-type branched-chain amino acid transport system, substrate-binding protein [Natronobacterium texcoconense]